MFRKFSKCFYRLFTRVTKRKYVHSRWSRNWCAYAYHWFE